MENRENYLPLVSDCILTMLNGYNAGLTQEQFYSKNILDVTSVSDADLSLSSSGVIQYCKDNGCYAALPPFEEGVFVDKEQGRYIHWKVLDVADDYFRISLDHYPIISVNVKNPFEDNSADKVFGDHLCWYRSCNTVIRVKILNSDEHAEMVSHHPDYVKYADAMCDGDQQKKATLLQKLSARLKSECYVGGVVESCDFYMPQDFKRIYKKGKYYTSDGQFVNGSWVRESTDMSNKVVAEYVEHALHTILFVSTGPMLEMFTYVNYMLSQKSTSSSTLRHITSIYVPNAEMPEVRKERHFGKIKVVSEKKPRSINADNIHRIYTALSWQRRSHLRHLKSGKVVPVKSATCKRHNAEDIPAPQVIYKV